MSSHRDADGLIRLVAALALGVLAIITGIVSYLHALAVVRVVGNGAPIAYLIPFVPDLMIVTSSLALLDAARHHWPRPALAIVSLMAGGGATLAMNVAAGWPHGWGGRLVAALPPAGFVLSLEVLLRIIRLARAAATGEPPAATGKPCPHTVAMSVDEAIRNVYFHTRDCLGQDPSQRKIAAAFDVSRPKVAALVNPPKPRTGAGPDGDVRPVPSPNGHKPQEATAGTIPPDGLPAGT